MVFITEEGRAIIDRDELRARFVITSHGEVVQPEAEAEAGDLPESVVDMEMELVHSASCPEHGEICRANSMRTLIRSVWLHIQMFHEESCPCTDHGLQTRKEDCKICEGTGNVHTIAASVR